MKIKPFHSDIFILQKVKTTEMDLPDSAVSSGAYRGKVVEVYKPQKVSIEPYYSDLINKEVFFDASKAFRLSTSDGEFFAIRAEHIIAEIVDE